MSRCFVGRVVSLVVILFATGPAAAEGWQAWQQVSPEKAGLVFRAEELGLRLQQLRLRSSPRTGQEQVVGVWARTNKLFPRLVVRLNRVRGAGLYFEKKQFAARKLLDNNRYFRSQGIAYGGTGSYTNVLGTGQYESFRSGDLHCFTVQQFAGNTADGARASKAIQGYYCDRQPSGSAVKTVRAVVSRLSLSLDGRPSQ